jgi:hypothetical protein
MMDKLPEGAEPMILQGYNDPAPELLDPDAMMRDAANSDRAPEDLIGDYADQLDGCDIPSLFEYLADREGFGTISAWIRNNARVARDIIGMSQSNPDRSWDLVQRIALLQDSLETE